MQIIAILFVAALYLTPLALGIIAFVRSYRIRSLEQRVTLLEAKLREGEPAKRPAEPAVATGPAKPSPPPRPQPAARPEADRGTRWEEVIGKRWLAWTGVSILLIGAGFGLNFVFESRWIGDLGRVLLGLAAGMGLVVLGQHHLRLGRRGFSQALTAGGATLLYLSVYASYGFYDLVSPTYAFAFLTLIVLSAHVLAAAQQAPGIALMGQVGGFLAPVLLATEQDRYLVLFSYVLLLNAGAILAVKLRRWKWISFVSFALAHAMYWAWREGDYHPDKQWAAGCFLVALFALFLYADLEQHLKGGKLRAENWSRLFLNPLAFFGAAYVLLEPDFPDWMGAFALVMAAAYAAMAKVLGERGPILAMAGISGLFATLAIPIQLDAHWVTLSWALQATVLAWLAVRSGSEWFERAAQAVFACAIIHYLAYEAPWEAGEAFTAVLNRDFASAAALAACLTASAYVVRARPGQLALRFGLAPIAILWLASTLEAYSYYHALLGETAVAAEQESLRWSADATVSVIWALYAAALVGGGMRFKIPVLRWTGLGLFGLTAIKVLVHDIGQLGGGYRVAALLVLGGLLVGAAWAYQRMSREESTP